MGKNYSLSCTALLREWELGKHFCLLCVGEQVSCLTFPSGQWSSCPFHIAAGVLQWKLFYAYSRLWHWSVGDLLAGVVGEAQFGKWVETNGERWGVFLEFNQEGDCKVECWKRLCVAQSFRWLHLTPALEKVLNAHQCTCFYMHTYMHKYICICVCIYILIIYAYICVQLPATFFSEVRLLVWVLKALQSSNVPA